MLNLKWRKGSHERREMGFIEIIRKIRHVRIVDVRWTHTKALIILPLAPFG